MPNHKLNCNWPLFKASPLLIFEQYLFDDDNFEWFDEVTSHKVVELFTVDDAIGSAFNLIIFILWRVINKLYA